MRIRSARAVLALAAGTLLPSTALAADFAVSATFPTYTINGAPNPALTLTRGQTYTFQIAAAGHPFWIKTAPVTGVGSTFDAGVTNNGVDTGTLTFQVPASAPGSLFYNCEFHDSMSGAINVVSAVPASRAPLLPAAALLLALVAWWALRARRA